MAARKSQTPSTAGDAPENTSETKKDASPKTGTDRSSVPALRVTARRDGFRRAGRAWPGEPTIVPLSELSEDQVALLRGESMLVVEDVEIEA